MIKVVRYTDSNEPLAMFELDGDTVRADYASPAYEHEIETYGLLFKGRVVRPSDGRPFMVALSRVYANSQTVYVDEQ